MRLRLDAHFVSVGKAAADISQLIQKAENMGSPIAIISHDTPITVLIPWQLMEELKAKSGIETVWNAEDTEVVELNEVSVGDIILMFEESVAEVHIHKDTVPVAAIYTVAQYELMLDMLDLRLPDPNCPHCRGIGSVIVEYRPGHGPIIKECSCLKHT